MKKILVILLFLSFSLACAFNPYPKNLETLKMALVEIETVSRIDNGDEIIEEKKHGIGFITDRNGTLMTNCHVVESFFYELDVKVSVRLADKKICEVVQIECNETRDIAWLKVDCDCSHLAALKILRAKVKEGDEIIFLDANGKIEGKIEETDFAVTREGKIVPTSYVAVTTPFGPGKSGTPILDKDYYAIAIAGAVLKKDKWIWYLAVPIAD